MPEVAISKSDSRAVARKEICLGADSQNLYSTLQQEVELGNQAMQRGSADMAITFFQSALHKLNVDQPFYDHLVHNLLLSYTLLIEQLLHLSLIHI